MNYMVSSFLCLNSGQNQLLVLEMLNERMNSSALLENHMSLLWDNVHIHANRTMEKWCCTHLPTAFPRTFPSHSLERRKKSTLRIVVGDRLCVLVVVGDWICLTVFWACFLAASTGIARVEGESSRIFRRGFYTPSTRFVAPLLVDQMYWVEVGGDVCRCPQAPHVWWSPHDWHKHARYQRAVSSRHFHFAEFPDWSHY